MCTLSVWRYYLPLFVDSFLQRFSIDQIKYCRRPLFGSVEKGTNEYPLYVRVCVSSVSSFLCFLCKFVFVLCWCLLCIFRAFLPRMEEHVGSVLSFVLFFVLSMCCLPPYGRACRIYPMSFMRCLFRAEEHVESVVSCAACRFCVVFFLMLRILLYRQYSAG